MQKSIEYFFYLEDIEFRLRFLDISREFPDHENTVEIIHNRYVAKIYEFISIWFSILFQCLGMFLDYCQFHSQLDFLFRSKDPSYIVASLIHVSKRVDGHLKFILKQGINLTTVANWSFSTQYRIMEVINDTVCIVGISYIFLC